MSFRRLRTVIDRSEEFKEILKEEKAEYKGYHPPAPKEIFEPEYQSIEIFVDFLLQENETQYTADQLEKLSFNLKQSSLKVIRELKSYGLSPKHRNNNKTMRGYRSPENKWASCPSHGGSGANQIIGFAN